MYSELKEVEYIKQQILHIEHILTVRALMVYFE